MVAVLVEGGRPSPVVGGQQGCAQGQVLFQVEQIKKYSIGIGNEEVHNYRNSVHLTGESVK